MDIRAFPCGYWSIRVFMLLNFLLAFGGGVAFNPPLDLHIPGPEELREEYHREIEKEGCSESIRIESTDEDGNSIMIDLS